MSRSQKSRAGTCFNALLEAQKDAFLEVDCEVIQSEFNGRRFHRIYWVCWRIASVDQRQRSFCGLGFAFNLGAHTGDGKARRLNV